MKESRKKYLYLEKTPQILKNHSILIHNIKSIYFKTRVLSITTIIIYFTGVPSWWNKTRKRRANILEKAK